MALIRNLFTSEIRCISNLIQNQWKSPLRSAPTVTSEYVAHPSNPRKRPWFNCDFSLDLVDPHTATSEHVTTTSTVLPNTVGAELFLVVQREDLAPMRLELIGGAAFPIKYYMIYIHRIEAAIQDAIQSQDERTTHLPWSQFVELITITNAAFVRLLVVGNHATFLYFPTETTPMMRGQRFNLVERDDCEIVCYVDHRKLVCFDGWIAINVRPSHHKLVALPDSAT